ncbi:hypothetical protein D9754_14840 [Planomicrobium sp. Y74]|nr:hypothetical protein D9754_14840 [Planomicrobium sp. Y74]
MDFKKQWERILIYTETTILQNLRSKDINGCFLQAKSEKEQKELYRRKYAGSKLESQTLTFNFKQGELANVDIIS